MITVTLTEAWVGGGALTLGALPSRTVDPLTHIISPWSVVTGVVAGHLAE